MNEIPPMQVLLGTDSPITRAQKIVSNLGALKDGLNELVARVSGVNLPPIATFTATQPTSMSVSVNGSGSSDPDGTVTGWAWDFGDGAIASGATATHTYKTAGVYVIRLTVSDDDGSSATVSKTVTATAIPAPVNEPPTASFTTTVAADGYTLSVDASASKDPDGTVVAYDWTFGDGATATGRTASHVYSQSGSFAVKLTVTDDYGAKTSTSKNVTITIPAPPPPPPSGNLGDTGGNGIQQTGSGITLMQNLTGADFSKQVNAAGSSAQVSLQAGTTSSPKVYSFNDFGILGSGSSPTQFRYGAQLTVKGLLGAGSKYSTVRMTPNTSTAAGDVPAQSTGSSNQLQYIFTSAAGFKIDGVKVECTTQGHLYNGLRLEGIANPTVTNCTFLAGPGNAGSPPGETFGGVNFQRASGTATVTNVTVDGQNWAAAAMGSNSASAHFIITNLYAVNCKYSAGWASWQQTGQMDFYNFVVKNGARAFNAERLAAVVNFYDPIWDTPFSGHSDVNPTYDGGFAGGVMNFRFTSQAAWQAFIANRTIKKITAVSNSSSVSQGLVKGNVINVYIAGVKQTQSDYVQWSGI